MVFDIGKNGKVLIQRMLLDYVLDVSNDGSDAGTNVQL